ncbi:KpsF/GutQ family sugar-phosphate isomerase [Orrella sp. 11846]|uniref:KpsF/GutQ family sugar-phosphate isomerase n=1 Tax=Orrella sp. 11846 TaxID=3409913 RepID=UPI003B5B2B6F
MIQNPIPFKPTQVLSDGRRTLELESEAVLALRNRLGDVFVQAVQTLLNCRGRVVVSGLGKSGHIARKIAATLSSTGTPALFMHASEALHGDLGMITQEDVLLAISYSGAGSEWAAIVPGARRLGVTILAMTGDQTSDLAKMADLWLDISVETEACPLNLAPTSSTTVTLAYGDALAVACLNARQFQAEDFARSHPGGALGRRLLTRVADVMRHGSAVPKVAQSATITQALQQMSDKNMGMTAVVDDQGRAVGIFTDGDLRRLLEKVGDVRGLPVTQGMTPDPRHIDANAMAVDAAKIMEDTKTTQLLVSDAQGLLIGALHMHDLMDTKIL